MASKARASRTSAPKQPQSKSAPNTSRSQWLVIGVLILLVLFGAYRVMTAGGRRTLDGAAPSSASSAQPQAQITGPRVEGAATLANGVQRISIDVTGVYTPNVVNLKAGVPAEVTFNGGQGCTSAVQSQQLNFREDLTGGPKTVKLPALQAGTYSFSCGMNMVFGEVVVK